MCFQKHVRSVYFFRSTNIFQNCKNYQNSFTTDWGHWFNILHVCPVSQQSMEPRREEGVGWEATAVLRPQPQPTQDIAQTWAWSRDFFEWHIEFVTEPKPKLAMSSCKRLYQPAGGPSHLLLTSLSLDCTWPPKPMSTRVKKLKPLQNPYCRLEENLCKNAPQLKKWKKSKKIRNIPN